MPPPRWPFRSAAVEAILAEAIDSGAWGQYHGPYHERLVGQLQESFQVAEALPCCSGTIAIELALRGLKVGPGDEVLIAGYDFPGNFRAIEAVGAHPVLVDIDPRTSCMDVTLIGDAAGDSTKAMIVSHLHGGIAPMQQVMETAAERNIQVVEDACQCPGATIGGKPAGSWGHVGALSFGGSKLLTSGRGGAILSNDPAIAQRIRVFRDRGNDAFPLSELQAACLLPQLDELPDQNTKRTAAVARLRDQLTDCTDLAPIHCEFLDAEPAYYKVGWIGDSERFDVDTFVCAIQREGVAIDRGFRGFVKRSKRRCRHSGPLPHSTSAANNTLILHHPVLLSELDEIDNVATAIERAINESRLSC